ncbi:MAG: secondary thiamine-phosphate synthase enzyme [Chloroflexi bacterium RBG_13_68_17]|nr:MAG: secondary thiamine-phosphate synthase enzyme [Chloroflexi bacterium RBG_13_68_17]
MIHTDHIPLSTRGHADMRDLTGAVRQIVAQAGIERGLAVVFCPSSTSALTTIEFESGALEDLRRALDEIAPADGEYRHNLRWGDGNGHSHLRAALLGPSLSIPILDSELTLGTWQQILYIDFDVRPRERQVLVQVIGEEP